MTRRTWIYNTLIGGLIGGMFALGLFDFVSTARSAHNWSATILAGTYESIDNLAFGSDDSLYATLETKRDGKVVKILPTKTETLLAGLHKPDGLYFRDGRLYVTEEKKKDGRVIRFDLRTGKTKVLAKLNNPEGIFVNAYGAVFVVEDASPGRLIRIDTSGRVEILNDKLQRAEGLAVDEKGHMYVAETKRGRVVKVLNGELEIVVSNLNRPDQIEIGPDGALWITEDRFLGRLLRYKGGDLHVIAEGLQSPQGMAFDAAGRVFVAEQGRNRILVFESK